MSDNIQKSAKLGDVIAISKLVESAVASDATVEARIIHHGVTLELNIKSNKNLDPKTCIQIIIKTLNEIQPPKITTVLIFWASNGQQVPVLAPCVDGKLADPKGQRWSKFLKLKGGQYKENTAVVKGIVFSTLATFVCVIGWSILNPSPETQRQCIRRVGQEIIARKEASGETTVKDMAEIVAYGEEFKRKCNVVFKD